MSGIPESGGRPVLLTVTGKQTDPEGNTQETTNMYRAVQTRSGEGYLFSYRGDDTDVRLFVSRKKAWMQRGSSESARMVFDPSAPFAHCDYETAYGTIPMEIRTGNISVLGGGLRANSNSFFGLENSDLQARIRYKLVMGQGYELTCSVTVKTQQAK